MKKNPIIQTFKSIARFTRHFYTSLHRIINGILLFGILFQTLIFFIELNDYEITVPRFLLTKIENFLSEKKLSYEASSIKIKLTGEINFENLKINYAHFSEPIITCDHLVFDLSIFSLIFGQLNPEEILIRNGTLFCPPSITPTGLNEALIKNFFGAITCGRRYIQINQLDFDFHNISVIAEGAWSKKQRSIHSTIYKNPQEPINFEILDYLSAATKLIEMKDQLSILNKPVVVVHITENETGTILLDLRMNASGCEFETIKLGAINVKSKLQYLHQKITIIKELEISAQNIYWNKYNIFANQGHAQISLDFNAIEKSPSIEEVKLSFNNVSKEGQSLDFIELNCNLINEKSIPGNVSAVHNNNWFHTQGDFDLKSKSITGSLKGYSTLKELETIVSNFIKDDIPQNEATGSIYLTGTFNSIFNKNLDIEKADFIVTSQELAYNNLTADRLYAEASFDSEKLDIQYLDAHRGKNHAKGSIYHNFKTQYYRYLLSGAIAPELLDPYLGSWWTNLMRKFNFSTPMPFGNIDIHGNLLTPNEWVVYGEFLGNNFIYQEIPVQALSLRLNSNQNALELLDLEMNSNQGQLKAYTKFQYGKLPNGEEGIIYTYINGSSALSLNELDKIIALPEVHEIIQNFSSDSPPQLNAKGKISEVHKDQTNINLHFTKNTPITFHQIPFNYMNFEVNYTSKETMIKNINVGFAEGFGEGQLIISPKNNGNPSEITANLHFLGVKQELAVDYLQKLWSSNNFVKANNYGGLLTLDLHATGTLGNWSSFMGSGNVSITQANLARINLFGILSQILSFTPFGIGSFHLTDATSSFFIQKNVIHFPDIHIFGSTASIDAKGNFYIETQQLAFILDISPLNKKGIPIISQAMLVLAPITQSFQMNLGGTLQDPKWDIVLTPLGFGKKKGPELPIKIDIAK